MNPRPTSAIIRLMNKIDLSHQLDVQQTLEMMLSPRMIQMLNVLNLSYLDLVEEINQKSEENVMLEIERHDRLFEYLKQISSERIPKKVIPGEELPGIESLADTCESLEDHLLQQLNLVDLSNEEKKIAESLIGNIDDRGYIEKYEEIKKGIVSELSVDPADVDDALEVVQSFEPEGVGARSLKECLAIQVKELNFETPDLTKLLLKVIEDHLEDLAKKDLGRIAKALKIKPDGVEKLAEFIKANLDPNPGSRFAKKAPCVIPSFSISKEKDGYVAVNLEKKYGPVIKLSPAYQKMLNDPKTDKESIRFLREKLEAAKDFLENIEKRNVTIERIIERIMKEQTDFFETGEPGLNPLMQKDIADELGLHPSTISRAIANKYLQTPKGVFSLKFLCPRDVKGLTSRNIERAIGDIIAKEDRAKPLGDDEIARKLEAGGISIKRRTVAAYRKKLDVGATSNRVSA